jgi:predicted nucleotidyltransferase
MNHQTGDTANLIDELRKLLPAVQDEFHVETLEVFGSYVRGEQK